MTEMESGHSQAQRRILVLKYTPNATKARCFYQSQSVLSNGNARIKLIKLIRAKHEENVVDFRKRLLAVHTIEMSFHLYQLQFFTYTSA